MSAITFSQTEMLFRNPGKPLWLCIGHFAVLVERLLIDVPGGPSVRSGNGLWRKSTEDRRTCKLCSKSQTVKLLFGE
jgi:hypothetical protein